MTRPKVLIDKEKLKHNVTFLSRKLQAQGISVAAVTKVFSAYPPLVAIYNEVEEVSYLADSRIENIMKYPKDSDKAFMLLRLPMLSEVEDVVRYATISLNSHIETIRALNEEAARQGKRHQIILMLDLGDLREGIYELEELKAVAEELVQCQHIDWLGLGVNLTCYGAVIPTYGILQRLVNDKAYLEETYGVTLYVLSGGNSSSLYLLDEEGGLPEEINNLRIGEAFVLGRETAFGRIIPGMYQDVFTLRAPIIEYRDKASLPVGTLGMNAFGEAPIFIDKGIIKRGIIALGRQDVDVVHLTPKDERLEILGSSSDHIIIDFSACPDDYSLGAGVEFHLSYGGLLAAFTSPHVYKELI